MTVTPFHKRIVASAPIAESVEGYGAGYAVQLECGHISTLFGDIPGCGVLFCVLCVKAAAERAERN